MEQFLANYKPPMCKKAKGSEKEVEESGKYENEKRKRGLNLSWKASFGWLEYHVINKEGKMFCNIYRRDEDEAYKLLISVILWHKKCSCRSFWNQTLAKCQ